jgi:hypothetical protein
MTSLAYPYSAWNSVQGVVLSAYRAHRSHEYVRRITHNRPRGTCHTPLGMERANTLDSPNQLNIELKLGSRGLIYARARHAKARRATEARLF